MIWDCRENPFGCHKRFGIKPGAACGNRPDHFKLDKKNPSGERFLQILQSRVSIRKSVKFIKSIVAGTIIATIRFI